MLSFIGVTAIFIHLHAPQLVEAHTLSLERQQKADKNNIRLHHGGFQFFDNLLDAFCYSDGNWPS